MIKHHLYVLVWALLCAYQLMSCRNVNGKQATIPKAARKSTVKRNNITFIMGDDKGEANPFYSEAYRYYAVNDTGANQMISNSCRSLKEIMDHLSNNNASNGLPWGVINIVVHGNAWTGLSIPVFKGAKRADSKTLNNAIQQQELTPLHDSIADSKTKIIIHACGLGKNTTFIESIKTAFGGTLTDMERPEIFSSENFILYQSGIKTGDYSAPLRLKAKPWYAFHKTSYRPADFVLSKQLNKKYPGESIKFRDALSRKTGSKTGDTFHRSFSIPVSWTVLYQDKESRPDISSKEKQSLWIKEQKDLLNKIEEIGIPFEYFNWNINKIRHFSKDGKSEYPAIKAIAECTVICVLEVL